MTTAQKIVEILADKGAATRREIAECIGVPPEHVSKPIDRLKKLKMINVIPRGLGCMTKFELTNARKEHDLLQRLAKATRYQAGGKMLIEAKFADEARELIK